MPIRTFKNIIFFLFLSSACSFSDKESLQRVKNDFETAGFLTHDIFQVPCSISLAPKQVSLFIGDLSATPRDDSLIIPLRKQLAKNCEQKALTTLANNWLTMKKKPVKNAADISHIFIPFLKGKIVYEKIQNNSLTAVYRIEEKNLISSIYNVKVDNY